MMIASIFDHFTQHCDQTSATYEILFMIGVSAFLGYLIGRFTSKPENENHSKDIELFKNKVKKLQDELNDCRNNNIKLTQPFVQIEEVKNEISSDQIIDKKDEAIEEKIEEKIEIEKKETIVEKNEEELIVASPIVESSIVESPLPIAKTAKTTKAKVTKAKTTKAKKTPDDLKMIEGIGPAIEKLMNEKQIFTFSEMAAYSPDALNEILDKAGPRYRVHDAGTWVEQAILLRDGKIKEFEKLTATLKGGRKR